MILLRVNTSADQVLVELWLLWVERLPLELVNWGRRVPERVRLNLVPSDSTYGILLQQSFDQIVEVVGKVW